DVLDIADALGWERFSLLGHSMGAAISGMLAATCPGRIERAVLIEGLAPLPGDVERTVEKLREWLVLSRGVADRRLGVFEDLELAVRARMRGETGAIDASSARLLVERGVREVVVD